MKTALLTTLTALALAGGQVAPAQAIIGGQEVADDDALARNVVQIGACTGTIIGPHWVLTAAHCSPAAEHMPTIRHGLDRPGARLYHTDRKATAPFGDVMLLHTAEAMDARDFPGIDTSTPEFKDRGSVYGWGCGTGTRLKKADVAVKQVHAAATDHGGQVIEAQYLADARPCRGDSGGPLFLGGKVAGVTSSRAKKDAIFADFAQLAPHVAWINEHLTQPEAPPKQASPTPTTSNAPIAPDNSSTATGDNVALVAGIISAVIALIALFFGGLSQIPLGKGIRAH